MRKRNAFTILTLALTVAACTHGLDREAPGESNKALVRDYLERLVNRGDLDAWPELIAGDTLSFNGQAMSREEMARMREAFFTILPDMHVEVIEQIAQDDVVASRLTITGTHLGDYMGMKASGQKVSFGGIAFDRVQNGRLVEAWHETDISGTLLTASDG